MSKYLHELCCSIIEDYYGEFYARIFHHLTHNGRFTTAQLAQKTHLPIKQVKAGLAALVQLRLVYHYTTPEGTSTYQANTKVTYDILRFGKLINLARSKHGDLAADIVAEASLLGFTTMAELQNRVLASSSSSHDTNIDGQNGVQAETQIDEHEIQMKIAILIKEQFLTFIRSAQFQTEFDASKDVELYYKGTGVLAAKGRKGLTEFEMKILNEVRDRQSATASETGYVPSIPTGQKRTAEDTLSTAAKRQKLTNGSVNRSRNGINLTTQTTTLICVNCKNVVAHVRNAFVTNIAEKSFGPKFGRVLKTILDQTPVSDPFKIPDAQEWLDMDLVRDSLNTSRTGSLTNGNHKSNGVKSHHHHESSVDRDEYLSSGDLDRYMASLSEGLFKFLEGGYSKGSWNLLRADLVSFAQQQESLRIMGNRLGPPSLRLVRMLINKGKLDEKTLQEIGLLGAKDLRQTLAELSQMGFIDLQEVPREAQRQPNRTIFLWFHDPERVHKVLLESLYKAMTRLSQRLRMERRGLTSTLEKVERSDVKGNEEQMLPAAEFAVWRRWQRKEEWMLGELSRLDESVAILRDL